MKSKLRVDLIKVSDHSAFHEYKAFMAAPPQNIFSVAAVTPKDVALRLIDETAGMQADLDTDAQVVGLFMSTPDAIRAYKLAASFKQKGKTVVFGGLHPTFLPDEALTYGDAVMIGEAEGVWQQVLFDFINGRLQKKYHRSEPFDLAHLQPYPLHLANMKKYNYTGSVVVSRGCRYRCKFCLVHRFFPGKMRYRPIGHIVEEIRTSGLEWYELHSDNLTADPDYARELFKALIPLKIKWVGETTINLADDPELLDLAAKSGLQYLVVGLEAMGSEALKSVGKGFIKPEKTKEYVQRFHEYGIVIDSCFIFGLDDHDVSVFDDTLDYGREIGVDIAHGATLIPFPGSLLFEQLENQGRILTKNWKFYDGAHAVFYPKKMTPEQLEEGVKRFNKKFYSIGHILKHPHLLSYIW